MRSNIVWFILISLAGLLFSMSVAFYLVDPAIQQAYLRQANFYVIAFIMAALVTLFVRYGSMRRILSATSHWALFALIVLYLATAFRMPFEFKVFHDEPVLSMEAHSLHFRRVDEVPAGAHFLARGIVVQDPYVNKRPSFYPALLALVHDITGFRVENAFYLNSFIYLLVLITIYLLGRQLVDASGDASFNLSAFAGAFLFATIPLVSLIATGGGFEMLNALFVLLLLVAALNYLKSPDSPGLWMLLLVTWLLANLRYESIVFVGFTAICVLIAVFQKRQRVPYKEILVFSMGLIPLLFQLNLSFSGPGDPYQTGSSEVAAFSVSYIMANLGSLIAFLFSAGIKGSNNLVLSVVGIISLALFIARQVTVKHSDRPVATRNLVFAVWIGFILLHLLVILSFHASNLTDPVVVRYSLPFLMMLALVAVPAINRYSADARLRKGLAAVLAITFFVFYVPAVSSMALLTSTSFNDLLKRMDRLVQDSGALAPLVISQTPTMFILQGYSASHIDRLRISTLPLKFHLQQNTYDEVFIVQIVRSAPFTNYLVYEKPISQEVELQEVARLPRGPYQYWIISKVLNVATDYPDHVQQAAISNERLLEQLGYGYQWRQQERTDWINLLP